MFWGWLVCLFFLFVVFFLYSQDDIHWFLGYADSDIKSLMMVIICRHRVPAPIGDMSFFSQATFQVFVFGFQETGNISSVDFLCVILFGIG